MSEHTATYDPSPVCPRPVAARPSRTRSSNRRRPHLQLAAETPATPFDGELDTVIARLDSMIDQLAGSDDDTLTDDQLRTRLHALRRPIARLEALRARWAATLERRTITGAPHGGKDAAQQSARRELSRDQQLTPSQAKRTLDAGRAATAHPTTGRAFADGQLTADHVRIIDQCLSATPLPHRDAIETRLLELATNRDPITFGRLARQLLAEHAPDDAAQTEQDRRRHRRLRATDTPDGGFAFSGLLYGTAAEEARVALHAFRRPDTKGEHRTTEQRTADAFEQLCGAALRSGDAPTQHGIRPHVIVIIDADQLATHDTGTGTGTGHYAHSGQPATTNELAPLLTDSALTRIALNATGTPTHVTREVRTVPHGLYRALLVRDNGCRWPGCDAPPSWCDVAHARTRYTNNGRLDINNALLLCRRHHRHFDQQRWNAHPNGTTIQFHHPTHPAMTSTRDNINSHPPPEGSPEPPEPPEPPTTSQLFPPDPPPPEP